MKSQVLYVIGNGFDLHHKIKLSYADFGKYVRQVDPGLHGTFEKYFSFEGNWADLENTLANIDVDLMIDEVSNFLVPYSADDWSDAYHHDYQYEIERITNALSEELKRGFTEWVCGLEIPDSLSCPVPLMNLDRNATYLTFNYTNTLQKLYGVAPANIRHIHNQAINIASDLVLGHGVSPKSIDSLNNGTDIESQDVRVTQANEIIDDYFLKTYKPTHDVIAKHEPFFHSLTGVRRIYVLGHSLSEVDWPYFKLISDCTRPSHPVWIVSYHDESIQEKMHALSQVGVAATQVKYVRLAEI